MQADDWETTATPEDEREAAGLETLLLAVAELRALCVPHLDADGRAKLLARIARVLERTACT